MADQRPRPRRRVKPSVFTIGGLAVFAALAACGGCGRPTAEEVARRVEEVYASAPELQQISSIVTTAKLLEQKNVRRQLNTLYYKRPGKLRLETGSEALELRAVCDGENLYARAVSPKSWLREPAPKKWKDSTLLGFYTQPSQNLVLAMLDGDTPLSSAEDLSMEEESERVSGTNCYVLSASAEGTLERGAFSFKKEQRLWVGTRDFLIRKCEVKLEPTGSGLSGPLGELMKKLQTSQVETIKPRLRLTAKADVFSFKSPPGTQVVKYIPGGSPAGWGAARDPMAAAKKMIGQKAPELSLSKWIEGPATSLAALKGKVVLLDFWATWCVPCVQTVPVLQRMHRDYSERGLVVIGIHDNSTSPAGIRAFMREHGMAYRVAIDNGDEERLPVTYGRYGGTGMIPMAVLIDRQGVIRWVGHPGAKRKLESETKGLL